MKNSLLIAAAAFSALFAGSAAMAADGPSLAYNIGVTNNYVFRGLTQTSGDTAVQGGIDYKNGLFYAGTWASNVNFHPKDNTNIELDLYAGVTPSVGNFSFDLGVISYTYPNHDKTFGDPASVTELKTAVSHPLGKGTIGVAIYTPVDTLTSPYYEVNASYPLTDKWSISGAMANNEANIVEAKGLAYTTDNIGLTYALNGNLSLDFRYAEATRTAIGDTRHQSFAATLKAAF